MSGVVPTRRLPEHELRPCIIYHYVIIIVYLVLWRSYHPNYRLINSDVFVLIYDFLCWETSEVDGLNGLSVGWSDSDPSPSGISLVSIPFRDFFEWVWCFDNELLTICLLFPTMVEHMRYIPHHINGSISFFSPYTFVLLANWYRHDGSILIWTYD